jgi:hypothetical protein
MRKFAFDYQRYRAPSLPRFLPALRNLSHAVQTTLPFGWGFAWLKEYPSCCAWLAGSPAWSFIRKCWLTAGRPPGPAGAGLR